MKALIQRVTSASVAVDGLTVAQIDQGLLILICAVHGDTQTQVDQLLEKIAKLRIFADEQGKMNRSVRDIDGGILLVPQFTLAADTRSGTRPSFGAAAAPQIALPLFEYAKVHLQQRFTKVGFGVFGADMQVSLVNDGPVTIGLELI